MGEGGSLSEAGVQKVKVYGPLGMFIGLSYIIYERERERERERESSGKILLSYSHTCVSLNRFSVVT